MSALDLMKIDVPDTGATPVPTGTQVSSQPPAFEVTKDLIDILQRVLASGSALKRSSEPERAVSPTSDEHRFDEVVVTHKVVNEVWDKKASAYTINESAAAGSGDEHDKYWFILRKRIDRKTTISTSYVDIKSKELQEVLMKVLEDVRGTSLREDKPTIEANLLYHFLPELRLQIETIKKDSLHASHLQVLIDCIGDIYAATHERLLSLLSNGEITYDLLWALFKPNSEIYATSPGTGVSMCARCNHGEESVRMNGSSYFNLEARQFDYDGKVFGEATVKIAIEKFRGARRIDRLDVFPLKYHRNSTEVRQSLVQCGRIFVSLIEGSHHRHYDGLTSWKDDKGNVFTQHVSSRVVVDPVMFRRTNPNYKRSRVDDWGMFFGSDGTDDVKSSDVPPHALGDCDLLVCNPMVMGYSLNDRRWFELAIKNVSRITWNTSCFDQLAIPPKQKKIIHALSDEHLSQGPESHFDDVVHGKGRGLIFLLHGPPGVGKTLTAEAVSEHLQRPLYTISAGQVGTKADELEGNLTLIFDIATHWNAVVLLDEADVFVEQRERSDVYRNSLVCVFLRKLEYFKGVMFLTTNRVNTIDEAIESRIHLGLRYRNLTQNARASIFDTFVRRANTPKGGAACAQSDIQKVARNDLNGRQIKNVVSAARALAAQEGTCMSSSHLEEVIELSKEFQDDFRGIGGTQNLLSYV